MILFKVDMIVSFIIIKLVSHYKLLVLHSLEFAYIYIYIYIHIVRIVDLFFKFFQSHRVGLDSFSEF